MSRDEASLWSVFQLCETPNLDFLVPVIESDSLDRSELLLFAAAWAPRSNRVSRRL
jgi:hypothetical protein